MRHDPVATILLRVPLTDPQAEKLQDRLNNAGLKVAYQEEQHGPVLMASIRCGPSQEASVRTILGELGITPTPEPST